MVKLEASAISLYVQRHVISNQNVPAINGTCTVSETVKQSIKIPSANYIDIASRAYQIGSDTLVYDPQ